MEVVSVALEMFGAVNHSSSLAHSGLCSHHIIALLFYSTGDGGNLVTFIGRNFRDTAFNFCKFRTCLDSNGGSSPHRSVVDSCSSSFLLIHTPVDLHSVLQYISLYSSFFVSCYHFLTFPSHILSHLSSDVEISKITILYLYRAMSHYRQL